MLRRTRRCWRNSTWGEGWYRRAPVPFVQIKTIECDGKVSKSWVPAVSYAWSCLLVAVGMSWWLVVQLEGVVN